MSCERDVVEQGDQIGRIGGCLLWAVFLTITEVSLIFGLIFNTVQVSYQFKKTCAGLEFERLKKLIWSFCCLT
jgi:hypothetical protein